MILDTTNKIEVLLAANVSTTQLDVVVDFIEYGADGKQTIPGFVQTVTNNSTAVTALPAPIAPSKAREPIAMTIYNKDVVAATPTVRTNNGTSTYIVTKKQLAVGETLVYEKHNGWSIV